MQYRRAGERRRWVKNGDLRIRRAWFALCVFGGAPRSRDRPITSENRAGDRPRPASALSVPRVSVPIAPHALLQLLHDDIHRVRKRRYRGNPFAVCGKQNWCICSCTKEIHCCCAVRESPGDEQTGRTATDRTRDTADFRIVGKNETRAEATLAYVARVGDGRFHIDAHTENAILGRRIVGSRSFLLRCDDRLS
jgi:hypothetical protein